MLSKDPLWKACAVSACAASPGRAPESNCERTNETASSFENVSHKPSDAKSINLKVLTNKFTMA